jgi:hypothetical protein
MAPNIAAGGPGRKAIHLEVVADFSAIPSVRFMVPSSHLLKVCDQGDQTPNLRDCLRDSPDSHFHTANCRAFELVFDDILGF